MAKRMSHLIFALLLSTLCLVMGRAGPHARTPLRLGVQKPSPGQLATGNSSSVVETKPKIRWVDCAKHVPAPFVEQNITLPSALPSTLHCGLLAVPMDYSKKLSSSNNITLGFAMYRPENPQGLLNYNLGGGNSEVASTAWGIAINLTSADIFDGLKTFDILAVDIRGAWQSNPLKCPIGNVSLPSYIPSNEKEYNVYLTIMKTYAQSCIDNSTPKGIVAHLSAAYTAKDWNSIRDALGYEKLDYLGASYGTVEGARYAHDFPEHTGRFVLDAIYPRGVSNLEVVTYQTKAVNRLLLRADAYCLNNTTCPFHSTGKGSIPKAFSEALAQAAAGNTSNATVSPSDIRARVGLNYLSGNVDFAGLSLALYAALNGGDWTGLDWTTFGPEYVADVLPVMSTFCSDQHIDNNTWAGFDALRKSVAKVDTAHIEYTQLITIVALCAGWPYQGDSSTPLPINEALLLVTSDFDYDAPTESSTFEFKQALKSTLVVRHGDDHVTFLQGPGAGPAYDVEIEFLKTGVFPKATKEEFMTIYPPGTTRGPIPDPYSVPTGPDAGDTGGSQPAR